MLARFPLSTCSCCNMFVTILKKHTIKQHGPATQEDYVARLTQTIRARYTHHLNQLILPCTNQAYPLQILVKANCGVCGQNADTHFSLQYDCATTGCCDVAWQVQNHFELEESHSRAACLTHAPIRRKPFWTGGFTQEL